MTQRFRIGVRLLDLQRGAGRARTARVDSAADLPSPLRAERHRLRRRCSRANEVSGRRGNTVFLALPDRSQRRARSRSIVVATDTVDLTVLAPRRAADGRDRLASCSAASCCCRSGSRAGSRVRSARSNAPPASSRPATSPRAPTSRRRPTTSSPTLASTLNTMAAQLEASRGSERAFLLSISHDLRTPLTSIRGYAEALADGTLDDAASRRPQARRHGDRRRGAPPRTARARPARPRSTRQRTSSRCKPHPCDASEIVRDAALAFEPQARELGIELSVASAASDSRRPRRRALWARSSRTSWRTR